MPFADRGELIRLGPRTSIMHVTRSSGSRGPSPDAGRLGGLILAIFAEHTVTAANYIRSLATAHSRLEG